MSLSLLEENLLKQELLRLKEKSLDKANSHFRIIVEYNQTFNRLVVNIKDKWGKYECDDYISSLLMDDRIDRKGFTPEVYKAITEIYKIHEDFLDNLRKRNIQAK